MRIGVFRRVPSGTSQRVITHALNVRGVAVLALEHRLIVHHARISIFINRTVCRTALVLSSLISSAFLVSLVLPNAQLA